MPLSYCLFIPLEPDRALIPVHQKYVKDQRNGSKRQERYILIRRLQSNFQNNRWRDHEEALRSTYKKEREEHYCARNPLSKDIDKRIFPAWARFNLKKLSWRRDSHFLLLAFSRVFGDCIRKNCFPSPKHTSSQEVRSLMKAPQGAEERAQKTHGKYRITLPRSFVILRQLTNDSHA